MIIKALAIAAAFSVQSTYAGDDTSIYGIAKSTPDEFSTLTAAVDAAGLTETLSNDGTFTVFAPRNDAFAKLPTELVDKLLDPTWQPQLQDVLLYHVLPNEVRSTDLVDHTYVTTVNGEDILINTHPARVNGNSRILIEEHLYDIEASNGVIHGLDTVLTPKSISNDIVDIVASGSHDKFSTLVAALNVAGLVDALRGDGPLTVFAPSNEAFDALPDGTVENLLQPENIEQLKDILLYHVVPANAASSGLSSGDVETLNGKSVSIDVSDGVKVNDATVTQADIIAKNGIIHVIDSVLLPPMDMAMSSECDLGTIVDVAAGNGSFETLVAAVTAADLAGTLSGDGPFTVFAPTDDAFADLPEGTVEGLLEDIPALSSILTYHVVAGKVESGDLTNGPVATVNGADVEINLDDGVKVNDSNVIIPDVQACNGVIHVIDAVLIPPTPEAAPAPEECDLGTIVDVAAGNGSFETLVAAVTAADLVGTLSSDGPFTVFAPTDDAFADLPEGVTVEGLLEDIPTLTSILTYHVVSGKVESGDLSTGPVTTVNGADVDVSVDDDGSVRVNDSNVIIPDVQACNGIIHVIDAVLIPPTPEAAPEPEACDLGTIVDVAVGNGSFGTLVAAVTAADLVETLQSPGPFTVFAPTDDAFAALPAGTVESLLLPENKDQLVSILTYHVVAGKVESGDLSTGPVTTVNGADVDISVDDDGGVRVNESTVIIADVQACNGVIHVIDQVLLPPMDMGGDDGGDAEISEPDKPTSGDMFSKSGKSKSAKSCSTKSGKSTKSCTKTLKEKQAKVAKALNEVDLPDAKAEKINSKSSKGCDYVGKSGKSGTDSGKSGYSGKSGTDSGKSGKSCSKSVKAHKSKMAGPKGSGMPATKPEESTPEEDMSMPAEPACDLGTIVDVAIGNGSFNTLVAAVTAAELGGTLSSDGPFTVFAPTDAAFAALPEGTVEGLLEDIPALTSILTYHVVAGKVESTDLVNGPVTTVNGADVEINLDDGVKVNDSNVIIADVQACNGVIHVIDAVLIPPTPEAAPEEEATRRLRSSA